MKKIFILIGIILTSGCATVSSKQQDPTLLKDTHGLVYVKHTGGMLNAHQETVLRSRKTGEKFTLYPTEAYAATASRWLPAGEYDVDGMFKDSSPHYTPIKVEAGRMTDLGGLMFFDLGNYERTLLPFRHPELTQQATTFAEQHAAVLVSRERIDWQPDRPPPAQATPSGTSGVGLVADVLMNISQHANRPSLNKQLKEADSIQKFYELVRIHQIPWSSVGSAENQGVQYFGASLGQIRTRDAAGAWHAIDTGTLSQINAIYAQEKRIVAIAESGEIRTTDEIHQSPWHAIGKLPENLTPFGIHKLGSEFIIVAGNRHRPDMNVGWNAIHIFSTVSGDFSNLKEIKNIKRSHFFILPQAYIYNENYFLSMETDIQRYSPRDGVWDTIYPGHRTTQFLLAAETGFLTAFEENGVFSKLSVSSDLGQSWEKITQPSYPTFEVAFHDKEHGQAIRANPGAFSSSWELVQFNVNSNRWDTISESPKGLCRRVLSDIRKRNFYCFSGIGDIFRFSPGELTAESLLK
ncbi:hypothetical protein [Chitinimonas sp. JJ19]|uniref:hypothetical protein n=1 Tax=Chitinimonas sp. JJ19 TaxID=3109352 RepID=UPI003001FBBA